MTPPTNPRSSRTAKRAANNLSAPQEPAKRAKASHAAARPDENTEDPEPTPEYALGAEPTQDDDASDLEADHNSALGEVPDPTLHFQETTDGASVAEDGAEPSAQEESTVATASAPTVPSDAPIASTGSSSLTAYPPATTEAKAIALLSKIGVEPGALVGLNLTGLNAIYRAVLDDKIASGLLPRATSDPISIRTEVPVMVQSALSGVEDRVTGLSNTHVPTKVAPFPDTMVGALLSLEAQNVPRERLAGMEYPLLKRINAVVNFTDRSRNVYAVNKIAVGLDWGIPTSFDNAADLVCEKGTSKAITVWVLGEVASQYWFNEEGFPAKRKQLHGLCMPRNSSAVADAFGPDQFRATRWMTVRGQRGQGSTTKEFADYYDARTALKDKSLMEKLSVEQITVHDIVLIEAQIGRYAVRAEGSDVKGKKPAMTRWQTFYDLQAVYLFKNASPVPFEAAASDFAI
ncbi:hypothetical protein B0H13DRAFT_2306113 [Mycena leptocephala]|nr:hypothetical protein B0H13DRAFT_2306113 [Mycena leptocephala]